MDVLWETAARHSLPLSLLPSLAPPLPLCHLLVDLSEVYVFLHCCLGYESIHLHITTLPNPKGPGVEENVRISHKLLVALVILWNGMEWNECFGMESGPVFCLQVRGWVPAGVKDDDTVCSSYVQTHSSTPAGKRRTGVCVCVCGGGGGGMSGCYVRGVHGMDSSLTPE